jgi:GNAT superfamily N-acetyltransferase
MQPAILVRLATREDADDLARLNSIFNEANISAAEIATQLSRCADVETAYLAEVDGRAVGFACLRLIPQFFAAEPYGELTELFVEESFRRQGVGAALIRHVEQVAREAGVREFFLMTGFKNTSAHHFYHAIGYSLRCFVMFKTLTTDR